jgi:hypothetical protein
VLKGRLPGTLGQHLRDESALKSVRHSGVDMCWVAAEDVNRNRVIAG